MLEVLFHQFAQEFANPSSCHSRAGGNPGDSENGKPGFRLALPHESGDRASLAGMTAGSLTTLFALLFLLLAAPSFVQAQSLPAAEKQKIEALINQVGALKDAKFVRNGWTYEPATAVRFLRGKWDANSSDVKSARDFIDKVATMSGTSGKPYLIRYKDGKEIKSNEFLLAELKKIEN
jgi:hypothetical protein